MIILVGETIPRTGTTWWTEEAFSVAKYIILYMRMSCLETVFTITELPRNQSWGLINKSVVGIHLKKTYLLTKLLKNSMAPQNLKPSLKLG